MFPFQIVQPFHVRQGKLSFVPLAAKMDRAFLRGRRTFQASATIIEMLTKGMPLRSFMSEHTAEYVLVPNLIGRLAPRFAEVIPIFFWSSREGNTTGLQCMSNTKVRVLSCFARRPKVVVPGSDRIIMKLNRELLEYSYGSSEVGIAVLAGIPLVSSLSQLKQTAPCSWFELRGFESVDFSVNIEYYIQVMLDGTTRPKADLHGMDVPLTDQQLMDVVSRSELMPWASAVEILRHIRSQQPDFNRFPFFGGYKPFHLLLPETSHF